MAKFFTKEEIEFLNNYADKLGYEICAQKLNRPIGGILSKLRRLHLPINKIPKNPELVNEVIFERNENLLTLDFNKQEHPKELAYFLGYFWADGYINIKAKTLTIEIAEEDGLVIEPILKTLANFKIYKRTREGRKPQMSFYYKDHEIVEILTSLGKYPRTIESHKKILEFIPSEYHIYFLRGLIDGDGCFYTDEKHVVQFSISNSFDFDWSYFIEYCKKLDLCLSTNLQEFKQNKASKVRCSNSKQIVQFISLLYKESDNIWLKRKYEKAMYIKNLFTN